jgi:transcriptional regulator with XRE-family HTH domain
MALGNILKEARMRKELTPSEVAAATRMKIQLVQAIEQEDFSAFPATIYGKGFIKLFAECVGVDPAPLIDEYVNKISNNNATQPAPIPKSKKILLDTEPLIDETAAEKKTKKEKQPEKIINPAAEQEITPPQEDKQVEEDLFSRVKSKHKLPEKPLFHPEQKPSITSEPVPKPAPEPAPVNIDIPVTPPVTPEVPLTEDFSETEITPIEEEKPAPAEANKSLYYHESEKTTKEPVKEKESIPAEQETTVNEELKQEKQDSEEQEQIEVEQIEPETAPVTEPVIEPEPTHHKPAPVIEQISEQEEVQQDIEPVTEPEPIPVITQIPLERNSEPPVKNKTVPSSTPPMKKRAANASLSLKKINLSDYNIKAISISAGILIVMILMISTIRRCSNSKSDKAESLNNTLQLAIPPADPYLE